MKRCSTLLIIRERQIKTTMRQLLTLVRMAIIEEPTNNNCWRACEEKGVLLHCWRECKPVQPLWRTQWRFLKKRKTESPYDPAIPLLGIYLEKALIQKDSHSSMFIATLFTIAKMWKQPKHLSIDQFSSIQFNRSVVSKSLRSHELQQARSPCPSPTPRIHSNSCPSSQ